MNNQNSLSQLDRTLERMSDLFHVWGFKRIHGKIWALLALSQNPLDAADLIRKLEISKALASISIRELLEVRAVLDVARSARGTRLYQANLDLQEVAYYVLRSREMPMIRELQTSLEELRESQPSDFEAHELSRERLQTLSEMLKSGSDSLSLLISSLSSEPVRAPMSAPSDLEHSYTLSKPEYEP